MAYSVIIILVNLTQAIMFHEVIEIGESDGIKMSAHDREEYRSAQIMLGFSLLYLLISYFAPQYFLIVVIIGIALRTTVTTSARIINFIRTRRITK